MTWLDLAILAVAIFSGATATVVGFGIGSLLTPLLAASFGTGIAVAAVTIPHALATAVRCWRLRAAIDRRVLVRFGVLSAAGGLGGALLYTRLGPSALTKILGALLLLTATAQLTGWSKRWRPHGPVVALLGLGSGFFGGIAGNQGGLRAAALTAFGLTPAGFVATATATGLLVDLARAPVYLWSSGPAVAALWRPIGVATAGVLIGTLLGERILLGLSRERFIRIVAAAIGVLGLWLLFGAR
ncbi:MAG TPA: TSUP family transporter [Acidobacteriota bacterium]|nr:TSUP family transporter [Acidobacteriota bacterium]